jgi:hypothetical protein
VLYSKASGRYSSGQRGQTVNLLCKLRRFESCSPHLNVSSNWNVFFCKQFSRFTRSFGTALPTKTFQAIGTFFFANNLAGSPEVSGLLSPIKILQVIGTFFFANNLAGSPEVSGLLSPLKRFKQLERFFFANNLAGSPTKTFKAIEEFFYLA